MASNDDYTPTRACPHPWCPGLHWLTIGFGLVAFAQTLFTGLASLLFTLLMMSIALGIGNLIAGKSLRQQVIDDALEEALGVHLVVRPRWALVAVGMDAFFVLNLAGTVALLFAHPHTSNVPDPSLAGFITVAVLVALIGFNQFAHRQATRPGKPKRVTMPAAADAA